MTIKEMEERSGLARANIRFYEAEGLFTPERKPNGYRDYSGEDLTTLLRVRLLRALGVSLEGIKAIQTGDLPLPEALGRHLDQLAEDKDRLKRAEGVCRETRALTAAGKTVMAQQREPDRGVFGEIRRLTEKEDRDA